jgi:RNA polymerase sigma factor (sigma-70 family)
MGTTVGIFSDTQEPILYGRQEETRQLTNVIATHQPSLTRIALRVVGNAADAEDAVQDAFLSAYTHLDQFKGQAQMSTWLTRIVINAARMKVRRRPRRVHLPLDQEDRQQDHAPLSDMLRSPANPRRVISNLGTRGTVDAPFHTALSYFAWNVSTPRGGWLEYSRDSTSSGNNTGNRKGASGKSTQKAQTTAACASEVIRCKAHSAVHQFKNLSGAPHISENASLSSNLASRTLLGYRLNRWCRDTNTQTSSRHRCVESQTEITEAGVLNAYRRAK